MIDGHNTTEQFGYTECTWLQ